MASSSLSPYHSPYSVHRPSHSSEPSLYAQAIERASVPFRHLAAYTHPVEHDSRQTLGGSVLGMAVAAGVSVGLHQFEKRSKSPSMPSFAKVATAVVGLGAGHALGLTQAGFLASAAGHVALGKIADQLSDLVLPHPSASAPATTATVHGEMGAEDPIIRAARAL